LARRKLRQTGNRHAAVSQWRLLNTENCHTRRECGSKPGSHVLCANSKVPGLITEKLKLGGAVAHAKRSQCRQHPVIRQPRGLIVVKYVTAVDCKVATHLLPESKRFFES
jgi:hypothetical protein